MNRKKIFFTMLLISICSLFFLSNDTFAQSDPKDLIKSVKDMYANECGNHNNKWNSTVFTVKFNWGSGCNGHCSVESGSFHCFEPGDLCTTEDQVHNGTIKVTEKDSREDESYEYYKVTIYADKAYQDVWGYVRYEKPRFQGLSNVTGSTSATAGWTSNSVSQVGFINNCSPTSGCQVSFGHYLRRTHGGDTTYYSVSRSSNMITSTKAISAGGVASGWFGGTSQAVSGSGPFTLYPGMVVCERLTFSAYGGSSNDAYTQVCASALGNAQPNDPGDTDDSENPDTVSGDSAFINIKVRNTSVSNFYNYQRSVYAKPGDTLAYRATYNPVLQYTYYLIPQQIQINSNGAKNPGNGSQLGDRFNSLRGGLRPWNNAFNIYKNTISGTELAKNKWNNNESQKYNAGSTDKQSVETTPVSVRDIDVGHTVDEQAKTSARNDTQTTPGQVSFVANGNNNLAIVDTNSRDKTATAYIPYNFNIDAEVTTSEDNVIYAGEQTAIESKITVKEKYNAVTDGTYVTRADNVRRKLVVYLGNRRNGGIMNGDSNTDICSGYFGMNNNGTDCGYSSTNNDSSLNPGISTRSDTFYAQDLTAGTEICVALAVFPANSGADTNWNDMEYSRSWRISDSKCYKVAKKPSMQVWGGNMTVQKGIDTAVSKKNNLAGYTVYTSESVGRANSNNYIFGSWNELGVVSSGKIIGFASGAATGYTLEKLLADPGGALESVNSGNFCKRSVLTLANNECSNGSAGAIGTLSNDNNQAIRDKEAVIGKLISSGDSNIDISVNLGDDNYYRGSNIDVGNTVLNTSGVIKVVHAKENIYVSGNIEFANTGYGSLGEVPKILLYAEKDIYIDCSVTRIDALLMAENEVKTCADGNGNVPDVNNSSRSNQLKVNGAIIARKLSPDRTYGAATGNNSITPAEIINFDPTLYLWAGPTDDDDDSVAGSLETTYVHELAPRQ